MNLTNKSTVIESSGYFLPEERITSDSIEFELKSVYKKLRLPFGRLELMTGIKERRIWPEGFKPSEISTNAALAALEKSSIHKNEIDLLIHSSVCRDFLEPATASVVHNNLGLKEDCMIFDLSNACLGFLNSIIMASELIESGKVHSALIVSGENGGPLLKETIKTILADDKLTRKTVKKYIANLTIGSAGVAFILTNKIHAPNRPQILGATNATDSTANKLCQGNGNTQALMMETDSSALLKAGISLAKKNWEKFKTRLEWENGTPDWCIPHQVTGTHEKMLCESLKLDSNSFFNTYEYFGNTGSAAVPLTLLKLQELNKIKSGDHIALLGIGSGLSSIMMGIKW